MYFLMILIVCEFFVCNSVTSDSTFIQIYPHESIKIVLKNHVGTWMILNHDINKLIVAQISEEHINQNVFHI